MCEAALKRAAPKPVTAVLKNPRPDASAPPPAAPSPLPAALTGAAPKPVTAVLKNQSAAGLLSTTACCSIFAAGRFMIAAGCSIPAANRSIFAAGRFITCIVLTRCWRQKPVLSQSCSQALALHTHDVHLGFTCVWDNAGFGHPTLATQRLYPRWRPGQALLPQVPLHPHCRQPRCSAISPARNLGSLAHTFGSPR